MGFNVAIYLDRHYAIPATVMVRSLLEHCADSSVSLYVLGVGLDAETKARMIASWPSSALSIRWVDVDVDVERYRSAFAPVNYLSSAAYVRLLVDRLLPPDVDRVLTLDCDSLVLDDIAPLWSRAGRHAVMAVPDPCVTKLGRDGSAFLKDLPVDAEAPYFNSGLLLIDLKRWREEKISDRCLELAARFPGQARYADQSFLNAVLQGNWDRLPVRWNCNYRHLSLHAYPSLRGSVYSYREVREALGRPAFVHFLSRKKPWHPIPFHPHREAYSAYLKKTRWTDTVPSQRNWRAVRDRIFFPVSCYRSVPRQRHSLERSARRLGDFTHFAWKFLWRIILTSPEPT